ncbi:MAG: arginine--tRNA ligase [Chloroflexi bacterium]|nr:arginine--tRNA ligase [Chloroflexota bacterium]
MLRQVAPTYKQASLLDCACRHLHRKTALQQLNKTLEVAIESALLAAQENGELPPFAIPRIPVSPPKRSAQGDWAYPAMGLARLAKKSPLEIARLIVERLPALNFLDKLEVAPPGFINCTIAEDYLRRQIDAIAAAGVDYFQLELGKGKRAQVEFVSANPSGPITIGHTRNAVVGDAMARLLEAAGYAVQREYYYNNAGNQMIILGKSLQLRYLQQLGEDAPLPADHYQGEYLVEVARDLAAEHGQSLRGASWQVFRDAAEQVMFGWIKRSLSAINIQHDAFYNETSLFESEEIWSVLEDLRANGHIYQSTHWEGADADEIAETSAKGYEPATWFRSATFGDEKDRVMVKSDGVPTYTLPDIAYHRDKLRRGFDVAVIVLGTDHFSQAQVVKCGIRALGLDPAPIDVIFLQMVRAVRWDEERGEYEAVKQSKRSGDFDTLDDLVAMTSADAVRYHMLARSPNSQLDFDVDQVVKQSNDNPVYYIQNAYVRCAGIFREAAERGLCDADADLSLLGESELRFIRKALEIGNCIEQAVRNYEPQKIAFFAQELAGVFHPIYDQVRVLHSEVPVETAKARLRFYRAAQAIFGYLLDLMGMSAPERM